MSEIEPLLGPGLVGGVYRPVWAGDPDAAARLREAGWSVAEVPEVVSLHDFYVEVAHALELPDYFGANLDALWDCLTDLIGPTALLWPGWAELAVSRADQWGRLMPVLAARTRQQPAFALVL